MVYYKLASYSGSSMDTLLGSRHGLFTTISVVSLSEVVEPSFAVTVIVVSTGYTCSFAPVESGSDGTRESMISSMTSCSVSGS